MLLATACREDAANVDGAFYDGDHRKVHCAVNLDNSAGNYDTVDAALDRAVERGEVVELYAHKPGGTIPVDHIEHVLAAARDRNLAFVTYGDMAKGIESHPGIALSFDDAFVPQWYDLRAMFQQYGARITFFVSRYAALDPDWHRMAHELADDGHEIAAHTVLHLRAPTYVEENGLDAYMKNEAVPSIQVLRDEGFEVNAFAYPFGARTSELDDALLNHVSILRSVSFAIEGVPDPCP